jgi:hypothetical protein
VTLSEETSAFLKGLKCTETFEHEVNTDEFKKLSGKTRSDKVVILIQKKQEVKKASTQPSPVVRVEKSFSQTLLTNLPNLIRESGQRHNERMDSLIKKLMAEDRTKQMLETDQIRVAAEIMIKNTREFTEGELLISLLQHYIETARTDDNPLTHYLDKLEVQTAVQYLAVKNHQGHFPLNDDCIKQAEIVAERLRQDLACWPMICDFYNNMSVSLHNIFDFSQATQRLHSLVVHLESGLKNPFQGSGIKCYEIGALFGSYSQTLAFDAHCSFFRTRDTKSLQQALDESEYYSELSREHFTDTADHERQITYQTHFKLQAYILTGEKNYLEAAGTLLLSDGKTEQAFNDFIAACPERRMLNPAYRVSVALKHAFLEGKNHPQTQALIDVILKNRDILPAYHPMEQILAYLSMAAENVNQQKQLKELLDIFKAPPNIVKTILLIMQLQVAYHLKHPIHPLFPKNCNYGC